MLHVTNGDSAAGTLRETSLGGTVLPWRDALHEGPVPALPRGDLLQRRAGFLADCGWGSRVALHSSLEERDRQLLAALRAGDQVVLWFEHDLYDQLQLIDVLTIALEEGVEPELIVVGAFPGRPSFTGLGELTAAELETLWPLRRPAGQAVLEEAAGVWAAFGQPEPTALAEHANASSNGLPYLRAALQRLLEELPAPGDGLSGTERRALQAISSGARTPAAAFATAQRLEAAPFLGDGWFYRTLAALEQGDARLLETSVGGELRLTEAGRRTLRGEADRVKLLGIDRWIGGTHVEPGNLWRYSDSYLTRDLMS